MHQYSQESVAYFVFHFRSTCLKIDNLSKEQKLDRFLRTLVPDIRMQVELRGPITFHEAAIYAERDDVVLSRVPSLDSRRNWQKQQKVSSQQRPTPLMKIIGETSMGSSARPEPMEIGKKKKKNAQ